MRLVLDSPTKLMIHDVDELTLNELKKFLSYKDRSVTEQIKRFKNNPYFLNRMGRDRFVKMIEKMKSEEVKTVLNIDSSGMWAYSGLLNKIQQYFGHKITSVESNIKYPEFKLIPWENKPQFDLYYYQEESISKLLENPHSHISLATGSGKSAIILNLFKRSALNTVVIAPSSSIVNQLYEDFVHHFGKKYVGQYGDGKKQFNKRVTIATAQGLARLKQDDEIYKYLHDNTQCIIFDESHTTPSNTFNYVCNKLFENAPYRWFTSATQIRNDGRDLILDGTIGKRVYTKDINELQEEGYLAKIKTLIFDVKSDNPSYRSRDVLSMNKKHFYENSTIIKIIAKMATDAFNNNIPTLILVDQHIQEEALRNVLKIQYEYACGNSDVNQICKNFNEGKTLVVIGTSAVSTGTNFLPVRLTINWQANQAETKIKQGAIGRSTRIHKPSGKTEAKIVDFRVTDIPQLVRHANKRAQYYKEVGEVSFYEVP